MKANTKTILKKCKVQLRSGFYGSAVVDVYLPSMSETIARIEIKDIEKLLESKLKTGQFEIVKGKGRKYQYLTLN